MKKTVLILHNVQVLFFSLAGLFFGLVLSQSIYPVALFSVPIAAVYIALLSLCQLSVRLRASVFLVVIIIFSLIVKIVSLYFFEYLMVKMVGIPFLSYNDDYIYDITSSQILNAWKTRGFGFYDDIKFGTGFYSGYPNISAFAKLLSVDHYLAPRFLNAILSVLTVPFFYWTTKHITKQSELIKLATIIFAFAPAFVVYSSLQLKETTLIFLLAVLLYGAVDFLYKGVSLKNMLLTFTAMCALLFFRAAILLPFVVGLAVTFILTKKEHDGAGTSRAAGVAWLTAIALGFYLSWDYLHSLGLLGLTGEEYFESRFATRGTLEAYQGSNDISQLGLLAVILGPLLALLSVFLPAPVYLELDSFIKTVPYHYFPLLGYYAIVPMLCVSILYLVKNHRHNRVGIFILAFLVLYKLGQAGSKSILDSRQSLPAIYSAYLLLAYFDMSNLAVKELWDRYKIVFVALLLIVMFSVTFLRFIIR